MLSRVYLLNRAIAKPVMMGRMQPIRYFRPGTINYYKHDPVEVSEAERRAQEAAPVWDRVFDHKKYMHHEGPLKVRFLSHISPSLF